MLLLLVGAAAVGILYVVKKASGNEDDWTAYKEAQLGESYSVVKNRFAAASEDFTSHADSRDAGFGSQYKEAAEIGSVRMLVVRSREDAFMLGFDKDNQLVYKN